MVVATGAREREPAWSPDGQWIAFASDEDGDFEICVVRPDGGGLRQLTHNHLTEHSPAWSPDGTRIAFVREDAVYVKPAGDRLAYEIGRRIEVLNLTTGEARVVVDYDRGLSRMVDWSR